MPIGTNTRPTLDVKESLTDPPRGDGARPGGGIPIQRGVPADAEDSAEEPVDTDEEEQLQE